MSFAWWETKEQKSKKNLSLTVALKFCTINIASAKKNEVVLSQWIIGKEYLIKNLARVGKVVKHVYTCGLVHLTWSSGGVYVDRLDSSLWYYLLSSYKSCIIEYLHK